MLALLLLLTSINNTIALPNIVFMLTDDLGWNSAWNNEETITPTLDEMSSKGLILQSFYTYKFCSPTRGSFLTGRYPFKLCATRNNLIPFSVPEGINLNYDMLPKRLSKAGYRNYHIGKWHQGLYTPHYTPVGRGFDYSYGFLSGGEDHFEQTIWISCNTTQYIGPVVDMYNCTIPAIGHNGTYNGYTFTNEAIRMIETHKQYHSDKPMFLYFALHNTHSPFEAPEYYVNMYHFNETRRNIFDAMVTIVDESVKNVTNALKANDLWNNTLFVWATDNGAPVQAGGSNAPFRGSKGNNFEGGVHVPAIISGGLLPNSMRGKQLDGIVHILDLFATFLTLAGLNPNDTNPEAPSPIDSINLWPYFSGDVKDSPRTVMVHDHLMYSNVTQGAIRNGDWKLIIMNESRAGWYGQFSPDNSWTKNMTNIYACNVSNPCLFNIKQDVTEHNDLSNVYPNITKELTELFYSYNDQHHPPKKQPTDDQDGYCNAVKTHQGFTVPWINATNDK
eukprot:357969_1